jgi:hypothetical protein
MWSEPLVETRSLETQIEVLKLTIEEYEKLLFRIKCIREMDGVPRNDLSITIYQSNRAFVTSWLDDIDRKKRADEERQKIVTIVNEELDKRTVKRGGKAQPGLDRAKPGSGY